MSIISPELLLALCAPFGLAAWSAARRRRRARTRGRPASRADAAPAGPDARADRFAGDIVDIEAALRDAMAELDSQARAHWVRVDLAMSTALSVRINRCALVAVLHQTMLSAIRAARGGKVLATAIAHGTRLHIRITDDGLGVDQLGREALARDAEALIALQGGSIAVEARPGQGTTVTVNLALRSLSGGEAECLTEHPVQPRDIIADQAA